MRRRLAVLLVAGGLIALPALPSPAHSDPGVVATAAKTCSPGWRHAVIGGQHKCLRRGQFCARSRDGEYHRYGYHCHKRDYRGNYHLT